MPENLDNTHESEATFSGAEQYANLSTEPATETKAEPAAETEHEPVVETKSEEELESDIHNLLISFPPNQHEVVFRTFPEFVTDNFDITKAVEIRSTNPKQRRAKLEEMHDRAVHLVGGQERAETYLEYPGLTNDVNPSKVRPASDEWLEVSVKANKLGPQTNLLIMTMMNRKMMEDIADGRATWEDVAYSFMDKDQISAQKEQVAKLHQAFRARPAMPVGHGDPHKAYTIPDARFQNIWRNQAYQAFSMGEVIAEWAEQVEGVKLPEAPKLSTDRDYRHIDDANVDRLTALFEDGRFTPYVETILDLYKTAEDALMSEEGEGYLREHRRQLNTRRTEGNQVPLTAMHQANDLAVAVIEKRIAELKATGDAPTMPINADMLFGGMIRGHTHLPKMLFEKQRPEVNTPPQEEKKGWLYRIRHRGGR